MGTSHWYRSPRPELRIDAQVSQAVHRHGESSLFDANTDIILGYKISAVLINNWVLRIEAININLVVLGGASAHVGSCGLKLSFVQRYGAIPDKWVQRHRRGVGVGVT